MIAFALMGLAKRTARWALLALAALLVSGAAAAADDEPDFYHGKTITIIIPIGPGGAYDAYARLLARHRGRRIPGSPLLATRAAGLRMEGKHRVGVAARQGERTLDVAARSVLLADGVGAA
jgi:hypothetical protein